MSSAAKKVLQDALALPEEDRQRVAELLIDSLPTESRGEIEQAWNEEAIWRAEQAETGEVQSLDGEEALRGIESRLRKLHQR